MILRDEKKEDAALQQDAINFQARVTAVLQELTSTASTEQEEQLMQLYAQAKAQPQNRSPPGSSSSNNHHHSDPINYFLLIVGSAWTAKTEMTLNLKETVEFDQEGYFLRGSFTCLNLVKPHSALFEAVDSLGHLVMARGDAEVDRVRKAAVEVLGDDVGLLVNVMPSLEAIVGKSKKKKNKRKLARDAKRFLPIVGLFFAAVASPDHPIVICLENLHLADQASLAAVRTFVIDLRAPGLVFVATTATSDDTVSQPASNLTSILQDMKDSGSVAVREIAVPIMTHDDVSKVLSAALECQPSDCQSLCQLINKHVKVSPVSLKLLLEYFLSENMIFGTAMFGWSWDERAIRKALKKDPVKLQIQQQVCKLGEEILETLATAACLGVGTDVTTLDTVMAVDCRPVISEAAAKTRFFTHERGEDDLGFWSEDVRQALYDTIPEDRRVAKHFAIGKTLWKEAIAEDTVEKNSFQILGHICKGVEAVSKDKEKKAVASLCLLGGQKATKLSAFRVASHFLQMGISLLSASCWRDEYDLIYSLHVCAAEMANFEASFDLAESYTDAVLRHARCVDDTIPAYITRIMVFYASERIATAIDTGTLVLNKLGVQMPSKFGFFTINRESRRVKRLLRGMSDEQLLRLPVMTNLEKVNAMRVLTLLNSYTMIGRVEMHSFTCLKMMQLTLEYGNSIMSSMAFAAYGVYQVSIGNIDEGYRFAKLSLNIHEEYGAIEYLPRVMLACNGFVFPWKKPYEECLEPLLEARKLGFQTGDVEMAHAASNLYCCIAFVNGKRLDLLLNEWTNFQKDMTENGHQNLRRMSMAALQTIRHLMGLTDDPLDPKGDIFDFDKAAALALSADNVKAHVSLRMWQMLLAFIFNDYALASKCALLDEFRSMPTAFGLPSNLFFGALICLQACRDERDKKGNLKRAKSILASFRKWSLAAPENFSGRKMLIEAEVASVEGRSDEAYEKFICSIAFSRQNPFDLAVANERLARHLIHLRNLERAAPVLRASVAAYHAWGAKGKAEILEEEMGRMLGG